MVPVIYGPREHHAVRDADSYRRRHEVFIARKAEMGPRVAVHVSDRPLLARIDANSWIVDCECGAGNATDPQWQIACCFGCGAVHAVIVFPDDATREQIEATLLARPKPMDRAWRPGESLDALIGENLSIGAEVPITVMHPEFQP